MVHLYYNNTTRGPGKVVTNLIKGLVLLNEKYSENTSFDSIVKDDKIICLQEHEILETELSKRALVGPNVCVVPSDNSNIMKGNYRKLIVPCEWVKKLYSNSVPTDKIEVWPVGVDTEDFTPSENKKTIDCLIYYKNRGTNELNVVEQFLQSKGLKYVIVHYGHYDEENFKAYLSLSKFCFMLDNTESQGLATLEIMASGLPVFVWDQTTWNGFDATSIPYWDDRCGIKYFGGDQLENKFNQFLDNLDTFNPRQYVIENLDLKIQAKKLIDL
mgnify:FL=1